MDWLALLALALIAGSGWCAAAETALLRVSRAGAKELARSPGTAASPLQAVLAEVPRYLAVLALARYAAEAAATVLTTVVALHVIGPGWRAYAAAAAAVTVAIYLATGIIPRIAERRRRPGWRWPPRPCCTRWCGCSARWPASWPGPAAAAVTAGPRRSPRRTCAAWSTCWNSARSSSRPSGR